MDQIIQYAVDQIDNDVKAVNPEYSKVQTQIKKIREKIAGKRAKLFELQENHTKDEKLSNSPKHIAKQASFQTQLNELLSAEKQLIQERKKHDYKINIQDMPKEKRYTSLKLETKAFQNIIKMICYRAEAAMANTLIGITKKYVDEKRTIIKSLINTHGNITPNYEQNTLLISLYSQSNPRTNSCLKYLCETLNKFET